MLLVWAGVRWSKMKLLFVKMYNSSFAPRSGESQHLRWSSDLLFFPVTARWEALQSWLKPLNFDGFQVLSCRVETGWPRRLSSTGTSQWTSRFSRETPSTVGARRRWRRAAGSRSTRTASSSPGKAKGGRRRCWTCHRWPSKMLPEDLFQVFYWLISI